MRRLIVFATVIALMAIIMPAQAGEPDLSVAIGATTGELDSNGNPVWTTFILGSEGVDYNEPWTNSPNSPVQLWFVDLLGNKLSTSLPIPYAGMKVYEGFASATVEGMYPIWFRSHDMGGKYTWDLDLRDASDLPLYGANLKNLQWEKLCMEFGPGNWNYHFYITAIPTAAPVPEPSSLITLSTLLLPLGACLRRRK